MVCRTQNIQITEGVVVSVLVAVMHFQDHLDVIPTHPARRAVVLECVLSIDTTTVLSVVAVAYVDVFGAT